MSLVNALWIEAKAAFLGSSIGTNGEVALSTGNSASPAATAQEQRGSGFTTHRAEGGAASAPSMVPPVARVAASMERKPTTKPAVSVTTQHSEQVDHSNIGSQYSSSSTSYPSLDALRPMVAGSSIQSQKKTGDDEDDDGYAIRKPPTAPPMTEEDELRIATHQSETEDMDTRSKRMAGDVLRVISTRALDEDPKFGAFPSEDAIYLHMMTRRVTRASVGVLFMSTILLVYTIVAFAGVYHASSLLT
jgi:hypothetical protein